MRTTYSRSATASREHVDRPTAAANNGKASGKGAKVPILRVQHSVPAYDDWKRAFDRDPIDREGSGVRRYQIHRPVTDPSFVMIDLEFVSLDEAEDFLQRLRALWDGPGRAVTQDPRAWIVETVETAGS